MTVILIPVKNYAQVNRANAKQPVTYRANYQRMAASKDGQLTFEIRGGTLWGWGNNSIGQLGDGTIIQRPYPVQIGTDTKWVSVSAGASSNLGLKSDGTLWAWGANNHGEVGDGTTTIRKSPVQIGTDTKWVSIASNYYHSVALKSDGTLWAWGYNANGELGDGTTTQRNSPVQIGTDNKWISISAGESFNLAVKSDGTLWAWGDNSEAQIGDGTFTQRNSPIQVGTDNKWVSVSAGQFFSLGLKSDGTLWGWGNNNLGELGDGTTTQRTTPVQVGSDNKWVSASAGGLFSLGLKANGTLWAWGQNSYGQLGDGTTTQRNSPVQIGSDNKWVGISGGTDYSLGLKSDGSLWAWGANDWGKLGDLTQTNRSSPVEISVESKWLTVQGGNYHTIGLKTDGSLWAWGQNYNGESGTGSGSVSIPTPLQVGNDNKWVAIACGGNHNLGLKSDGTLWAWGFNGSGQVGDGSTVNRTIPVQVGTDNDWANIAAGYNHSIALKANGTLWAWGNNSNAQLGDGTTTNRSGPIQIGSDNKWVNIKAGTRFTVAIKSDGTLWAWGANDVGQLGDGTTVQKTSPVQIGTDTKWNNISVALSHSMAIKSDGTLWAWGGNSSRQLGDGTATNRSNPIQIGTDTKWINVQAGQNYSIGLKSDGTFWAWGANDVGQLGDGTNTLRTTPVQIGTETKWVNISAGGYHSIGLKSDRAQYCATGNNITGQLGDNTTVDKNSFICNTICSPLTPSININTDVTSPSICAGDPVTFTAIPFYGGTTPIFQWKKDGVNVSTNSNQYTDASLTSSNIVNCVLTSNEPCATTTVATSNSISMTVTPLLTAAVTNNGPICYGNTAVFTFTGTSGATAYYDIDGVPGSILMAGGTATISIANATSNKTLTLGSASGGACPQVLNATSTIIVNSLPIVGATASPSLTVCQGTTVTLSGTGASTYTWSNGITNGVPFVPQASPSSLLAAKVEFSTGANPNGQAIADIDGDGFPDMVVANYGSNTISVYRNSGISGSINNSSFPIRVDFATGANPAYVAIADIDGDGKKDIAVTNYVGGSISVFRNTSTVGVINGSSLAPKVDFATGTGPNGIAFGEIDADNKPDIIVTNYSSNSISLFRNLAIAGTINSSSLQAKIDFATGTNPAAVSVADIDGDGIKDLAITNYGSNTVSIFRGNGYSGNIYSGSLAAKVDFTTGSGPISVDMGDIDGDGKKDIVVANFSSNTLSVYRNTSTAGNITAGSLAAKVDFASGVNPYDVAIGDIDGDGKQDMISVNYSSNTISLFRNTSTSGSINAGSIASKIDYTSSYSPFDVSIADMDKDGKNDVVVSNIYNYTLSVFRNQNNALMLTGTAATGCTATVPIILTVNASPSLTAVAANPAVCVGSSTTLSANSPFTTNYTVGSITYAPVAPSGSATPGPVGDEVLSSAIPIGFNFNFYGINYSNLYIGTNGFITFNPFAGSGCCSGQFIPNSFEPNNLIAVCWTDLTTNPGGTIDYFNLTSPNRFVVRYTGVYHYSGTAQVTSELILYQSGTIEIHNTSINSQGTMTQGIENATGVLATAVSGRNATGFTAINDAYRFTPPATALTWSPANGLSSTTGSNVTASPAVTTNYTVTMAPDVNGCTASATVSVNVNPLPIVGFTISPSATVCSGTSVTLNGTGATTYTWSGGVTNGTTFIPIGTSVYTVTGTDANGCTNTNTATITVNPLPSTPSIAADGPLTFCAGGSVNLTAPAPAGNALAFDGVDDYVSTNLSLSNYTNFTLEGWVLYNSLNSRMGIFGQDGAIEFGFISNSVIECWTPNGASLDWTFNNTTLPIGQWNHLAVVGDGSTIKLYVNGNLVMTSSFTTSNYGASTGKFNMGGAVFDPLAIAIPFNGKLDEVRVWNVARTASQIQSSFTSSVPVNTAGLVAYYKLDETSGSTTADATTNGNTGSLNNGPSRVIPSTVTFFGTDNYLWSTGATTQGINVSATGSYNVSLINSFGCISTSNPVTVTVNPLPAVSFSGLASSYCVSAAPVSLTGVPSGGIFSGTGITGNVFNPATAGTYIITYTYTNPNGCINSATQSVTVSSLPTVTVNASPNTICSGNTTTLTANGAATYTWMPGSLSGASITVSPLTTTTYTVTGVSAAGCEVAVNNSWVNISGGSQHSVAIKSGGTLWAWGWNLYGQLGNGSNTDSNVPVQVGSSSNWVTISAGWGYNLAIKSDGTLWSWGYNANGQLGDGSTADKNSPVQIGTATNWASISAGNSHSMGIKTDGTLWAWGRNNVGQLGDGSTTQRNSPVQIGTATNWANVTTGDFHSLATKTNGTLWAWGANTYKQLGDGTNINKNSPVQIGTATDWARDISAGFGNSLAVKQNGTLWAWGLNDYGQLGDGTNINKSTPTQIGASTNWSSVTAGAYHSQAIKTDGTLWGWGDNEQGQSGDGTLTSSNTPVQIGASSNWSIVAAGGLHSLGIKTGGSLWGWGYNPYGQIGDGTITDKSSPVQAGFAGISVTVTVNPLPAISFSGLASNYCTTDPVVTLTGSQEGGVFSGTGIVDNTFDPAIAGAGGPYTVTYAYTNENGCTNSITQQVTVNSCENSALDLKLFLEGYYTGSSNMSSTLYDLAQSNDPTASDNITVNLWSAGNLSNEIPDYSVTTLLHTSGTATVNFPAAVNGNSFYIAVKHRNSIETWSHDPVLFTTNTLYDFSTGLDKAYDDGVIAPMKNIDGVYAFYAGDINQDGAIDGQDMNVIDNEIGFFGYNISDVNGDGATDGQDMNFVDNNSQLGLFFARPY